MPIDDLTDKILELVNTDEMTIAAWLSGINYAIINISLYLLKTKESQ